MGLSGRRRAKKPNPSLKATVSTTTEEAQHGETFTYNLHHRNSQHHHGSGNTYRRVGTKAAREMKRSGFVSIDIERHGSGSSSALRPDKPRRTSPAGAARPNPNLGNKNMVRIMDDDFDSRLDYSLNKKSRWDFEASLADQYNSDSQWQLRQQNVLVFGSEWSARSRSGRATHRLATNVGTDRQGERQLMVTGGSRLNRASMRRSLDLAIAGRADADARATVCVDVLTPRQPRNEAILQDTSAIAAEGRQSRGATKQRRRFSGQEWMTKAALEIEEALDWDEDVEEMAETEESCRPSRSVVTVFEIMQLKQQGDSPMKGFPKTERLPARTTGRIAAGILLSSALENDHYEDNAEVVQAAQKSTERLAKVVQTVLRQMRPTLRVSSMAAAPDRLERLFAGTEALSLGGCRPRRLAVLLQPNLSESVTFEEAGGDVNNGDFVTFTVRHNFSGPNLQARLTSAQEIVEAAAAIADPFVHLRQLVVSPKPKSSQSSEGRLGNDAIADGWCRTVVVDEAEARLRAVRDLPMFAAAVSNITAASNVDADANAECAICCSQLLTTATTDGSDVDFAQRSTALDGCGHRFCNTCWVRHVTACVVSGRVRVGCPGHGCPAVLDAAALLGFCPVWLLPALAAAAFRNWLAALRPSPRSCPNPQCGSLLVAAATGGDGGQAGWNAACPACWSCLCLLCGQEPHWPSDCATADRYRRETVARGHAKLYRDDLLATADVRAKQCPTCQLLMEKGAGCNHMTCPCGESFCWHCGRRSRDHALGGLCSSRNHIRTGYRVSVVFAARDSLLVPSSWQSRLYCVAVRSRLMRRVDPSVLRAQHAQVRTLLATAGTARLPAASPTAVSANAVVLAGAVASYLVEYACARLDAAARPVGRASAAVAVAAGERILELVEAIGDVARHRRRRGAVAAIEAVLACQRLSDLRRDLAVECSRLRRIVASVARRMALNDSDED